jgi:hypothetical protein
LISCIKTAVSAQHVVFAVISDTASASKLCLQVSVQQLQAVFANTVGILPNESNLSIKQFKAFC